MAKINKRIERSYKTYLKYRAQDAAKGYGLDRELTISEYADAHASYLHSKKGSHPARDIARAEKTFTRSEASAIIRRLKSAGKYSDVDEDDLIELRLRYKKAKDIYGLELTREEIQEQESERRNFWRDKLAGEDPDFTIQANARAKLFQELLDIGLSYREADEVLYG